MAERIVSPGVLGVDFGDELLRGYLGSPNQIYPPSQSIKMFGADFENDQGKILLSGNVNITSPTNTSNNCFLKKYSTSNEGAFIGL